MSDTEKIAREIALKVCENWEVTRGGLERSLCVDAATLGYEAGYAAAREQAAKVAQEFRPTIDATRARHAEDVADAIRKMEPNT